MLPRIKLGDEFRCIKTIQTKEDGVYYKEGKTYIYELETKDPPFSQDKYTDYFTKIDKKKRKQVNGWTLHFSQTYQSWQCSYKPHNFARVIFEMFEKLSDAEEWARNNNVPKKRILYSGDKKILTHL